MKRGVERLCMVTRHARLSYVAGIALQKAAIEEVKRAPAGLQSSVAGGTMVLPPSLMRDSGRDPSKIHTEGYDRLLAVTHAPVFSVGKRIGAKTNVLDVALQLQKQNKVEIAQSNRGGDVTYHGPGQLVLYPILNLQNSPHRKDLSWYLSSLEECMIRTLKDFGIDAYAGSGQGASGAWVGESKIGAIGIHASGWITSHGLALNVHKTVHPYFDAIIPCGLANRNTTCMETELEDSSSQASSSSSSSLKKPVTLERVHDRLVYNFADIFQIACVYPKGELDHPLE